MPRERWSTVDSRRRCPAIQATYRLRCADQNVAASLQPLQAMDRQRMLLLPAFIAVAVTLALGVGATLSALAQERSAVATGARLFVDQGCYGCHRIGVAGTPIGPDLSRVGAKYSESDLIRWLSDPASQKPNAHMPKLELSSPDIVALAAFLATQR